MNTTMISSANRPPVFTGLSTQPSFLEPNTHLTFSAHFPKSTFPLKITSRPTRTASVKASASTAAVSDAVYVDTQSFYELLGISESVTLSEIKKAYKQLARKYHPDVSPPDRAEEYTKRFIQVQEAYETLSDPETRALYDRDMRRGFGWHTMFSSRKRSEQGFEDSVDWEERWQSQLSELIRKSNLQESEDMSWGAKMRSKRSCTN